MDVMRERLGQRRHIPVDGRGREGQPIIAAMTQQRRATENLLHIGRLIDDPAACVDGQPPEVQPPHHFRRNGGLAPFAFQRQEVVERDLQMRPEPAEQRSRRRAKAPIASDGQPGVRRARVGQP